jgi:hypothetical protein
MRVRVPVVVIAGLLAAQACVPATPTGPSGSSASIEGTSDGASGFAGCGVAGEGTYEATVLGRGTYRYEVCTVDGDTRIVGTFTFVTEKGAQLVALVDEAIDVGFPLPLAIDGGTGRYDGATGTLGITFEQYDATDCQHGTCFRWRERGTIAGTIELAGPPK